MGTKKIPTIIGIIILTVGLAIGVALVQFRQVFKLGAAGGISPKDVKVTNISDSQISISWLTEKEVGGFVKWGQSQDSLTNVEQDTLGSAGFTHMVNLRGLAPQTTYFFKINSGGDDFDNNGAPWQITSGPTLPAPATQLLISGTVLLPTGIPSKNSLVYVSASGSLLSTSTSPSGTWVIPLSQVRALDLLNYLTIDPKATLLEISVEAGPDGVASAKIYPQSANPAPAIVLGQVYDLRNLPPNPVGSNPNANIPLGEEATGSSKFSVPQGSSQPSAKTITLDSTKNGEVVTTTKPEFFGSGPPGTKLSITLHSDPVTGNVSVSQTGQWQWNPPANLSPGTHTITLSWTDAAGILRTLTRTFIVQASEGPAFVSTPSATLTPTPSPTPIPTLRPTPTPTSPPTPVSGDLTPTLLLFIMGIGTLSFSFFLWKEAGT